MCRGSVQPADHWYILSIELVGVLESAPTVTDLVGALEVRVPSKTLRRSALSVFEVVEKLLTNALVNSRGL